jgi:hypothetical protein
VYFELRRVYQFLPCSTTVPILLSHCYFVTPLSTSLDGHRHLNQRSPLDMSYRKNTNTRTLGLGQWSIGLDDYGRGAFGDREEHRAILLRNVTALLRPAPIMKAVASRSETVDVAQNVILSPAAEDQEWKRS